MLTIIIIIIIIIIIVIIIIIIIIIVIKIIVSILDFSHAARSYKVRSDILFIVSDKSFDHSWNT